MDARNSSEFILTGEVSMQSDDPELLFERVLARRLQREIAPEDCPDAGILAAFHEGTLSNDETSICRMHVTKCARCKSVIEALEGSDAILSPEQEYVPSADAATPEVLGYGAGDRKSVRPILWTRLQPLKGWLMPATVAVAAGFFVLIGILVIHQNEKGTVQMAMNKPPIEKLEKKLSPDETVRPATEMTSQKKAELKTEKESRLKSQDIKRRLRSDTRDSDAAKSVAPTIDGEYKYDIAQLDVSDKERSQRPVLKRENVDSEVSKDSVHAVALPEHNSPDIVDEFKVVLDRDRVAEQIIGHDELSLNKALSDNKAKRMDKDLPIVRSDEMAKQEESARTSGQFLVASPDTNVRWRFGAGGLIEKSIDGGKSWERQSSNVTDDLLSGVAPAEKICWLAGMNGTVLLTTDGEHWTRLPFPSKIDLGGITSNDALHALVWDTQNKVKFSTEDGGNTWTEATETAPRAP
jgi:hypothetical protein